jgi:DHA1 family inner membrane transport protein
VSQKWNLFVTLTEEIPLRKSRFMDSQIIGIFMPTRPQVWLALAMTACSFGAIATTFTDIAPLLQEVNGFYQRAVTGVLFVIGLSLFVGNYIGGKTADKNLMGAIIALFAGFIVVLLFEVTAHYPIAAVITAILFGVAGYGLVPGAQLRVVAVANDALTLASALNISAFNVGVMIGAALGAAAIDAVCRADPVQPTS